MTSTDKIAAIIVTYNRAADLLNCMSAVVAQTRLPDNIYIIDNHSTDDTKSRLEQQGYIGPDVRPVKIEGGEVYRTEFTTQSGATTTISYLYKDVNDGGAGGFYAGMKLAFDEGNDWLWMMDDDGYPVADSLELLYDMSVRYGIDYANPMVVRTDDPTRMPWRLPAGDEIAAYEGMDIYEGHVNPFNGTFVSRKIPEAIGFIKREMFIWGDEVEYTSRVRKAGYHIATVCPSRHFHPNKPGSFTRLFPFTGRWTVQSAPKERQWLLFRNLGYIYSQYYTPKKKLKTVLSYVLYFTTRFDFAGLMNFCRAFRAGIKNRFDR